MHSILISCDIVWVSFVMFFWSLLISNRSLLTHTHQPYQERSNTFDCFTPYRSRVTNVDLLWHLECLVWHTHTGLIENRTIFGWITLYMSLSTWCWSLLTCYRSLLTWCRSLLTYCRSLLAHTHQPRQEQSNKLLSSRHHPVCICVRVCVCARARACACVCVCVRVGVHEWVSA